MHLPSNVKSLYSKLIKIASQFKSPAYKSFFTRKVNDDFDNLKKLSNEKETPEIIDKYYKAQKELLEVLKRQTKIFNMFYDETSNI